jgi:succinate-semialdehyde dehydrogenase/glutarate-semialdehyde dehydrogenase
MTQSIVKRDSRVAESDIVSYGNYIGGRNVAGDEWIYALSPRAVLDDAFTSLTLKRKLEQGDITAAEAPPGVVIGRVAVADDAAISAAMTAAATAAAQWRSTPRSIRVEEWLSLVHDAFRSNADTIERMLTLEGHPLELARWEISGMLEVTQKSARDFIQQQLWSEYPAEGRRRIVRRQPDGVVCVNPPANAPMVSAMLGALSIAAGNAVIVRAPRSAPLSVMYAMHDLVGPTLDQVGAPPGTLNAVCGSPGPILDAWIDSPDVDDVMYFGSSENGLEFERRCVAAGKKPILELAGNDIVIIWSDANLEYAAQALVESFYGSGQLCMIPNQAVVHPAVADELITRVVEKAQALRPGYPDEEGVLLSPVLRHEGFYNCLADAVEKGARVMTGGSGLLLDGTRDATGFFLEPTVLRIDGLKRARALTAVKHETFFPLLPIIVADDISDELLLDECIDFVNSNLYGLRNSLWSSSEDVVDRFVTDVTNGGLLKINDSHIAFCSPLPTHGGNGLTGGVFGEANYPVLRTTRLQGVCVLDGAKEPSFRSEVS